MKYNLRNFDRFKFPLSEEEQAILLKELDMMEAELRQLNFFEWIQEHQEEIPLGYSKAQLLELFVKKEILGE